MKGYLPVAMSVFKFFVDTYCFSFSARSKTACKQITESIRTSLKKYKFQTFEDSVKVLSGKDEGTFGWVTVNMLKKRIAEKQVINMVYHKLCD